MNGRRIDHPKPKGSKDLSDALACVVWAISQDERRYRYHEVGKDKIRSMGKIHSATAFEDIFDDGRALFNRRSNDLSVPRKSNISRVLSRKTVVTQQDW